MEGLTTYAQGVYEVMQGKNISEEYRGIVTRLNSLLEGMDSKYYSELEGKSDGMKKLVGYLNTQHL